VKADCSIANGFFWIDRKKVQIEFGVMTRAYCGDDSQIGEFVQFFIPTETFNVAILYSRPELPGHALQGDLGNLRPAIEACRRTDDPNTACGVKPHALDFN
jgi:hypothetical protein